MDALRPTRVRWSIFGLACAVSWLLYLHRYAWGVVRPSIKKENPELTDFELGWLDSLFNITYAFGQVPGGLAADCFGARAVLPGMILAWSACLAAIALVGGFAALACVRALFGAAQAGAYPTLSKVTRSWFPPAVRTTVQGMVASLSGRAGGACASILVATVLMHGLGLSWQTALLVLSSAGVVLAGAFWLVFRNSPREHPWANAAEARLVEAEPSPAGVGERPRLDLGGPGRLTFAAMMVYAFASTFADQLFVFWLPQFLSEEKGLNLLEMGLYASLPLFGGALGGAVGGILNDVLIRLTGNRKWSRRVIAFTGKLLGGVLLVLSIRFGDGRHVMLVLFACKFFGDWSLSTLWGTITDVAGRASGTVFGIVNMSGSCAGFVAGPVMGWVKQEYGWDALFFMTGSVFVFAALCWLFIDCTRKLVREVPA